MSTRLPLAALTALLLTAAPAATRAEVLWRGDFETGDLEQWDTTLNPMTGERANITVVSEPVFAGGYAAAVTIHPDDSWSNGHNRVELHYDAQRTAEGETTFFSWFFMLPEHAGVHEDIAYWETDQTWQQSMALYVEPMGGGTQLSFRTNRPNGMVHWSGAITAGAWHQLAMQILWSTDPGVGTVSLWLDGELVVDSVSAQTKPDQNPVFVQMGFHRNQSETPVETIYIDDAVEGTTLDDVLVPPGSGGTGGSGGSGGLAGSPGSGGGSSGTGGGSAGSGGTGSGGTGTGGSGTGGGTSGGSGGSSAGGSGGAVLGGSSGSAPAEPGASDDSGCSCQSPGNTAARYSWWVVLGLSALVRGQRRRARSRYGAGLAR